MKLLSVTYLPMDCPQCSRRRLLAEIVDGREGKPFVWRIECEKCGREWPDDPQRSQEEQDALHGIPPDPLKP